MIKISGVYKITNKITGDLYIGSSKDIKCRWANHKSPSTRKRCPNVKLYKAFTNYGLDNFLFEVLEETDNLREREQYYIEKLKPSYNNVRANGLDIERYKEDNRRCHKEWNNRLCLYKGETLTFNALSKRFHRAGIEHAYIEAKKYLIGE